MIQAIIHCCTFPGILKTNLKKFFNITNPSKILIDRQKQCTIVMAHTIRSSLHFSALTVQSPNEIGPLRNMSAEGLHLWSDPQSRVLSLNTNHHSETLIFVPNCLYIVIIRRRKFNYHEEVFRFQCLFPNPNWLVWKGILPPKTRSNTHGWITC